MAEAARTRAAAIAIWTGSLPEGMGRSRLIGWWRSFERSKTSFIRYTALDALQKRRKQAAARAQATASKSCPAKIRPARTKTFLSHCFGLIASRSAAAIPCATTVGGGGSATALASRTGACIAAKIGTVVRRALSRPSKGPSSPGPFAGQRARRNAGALALFEPRGGHDKQDRSAS